MSTYCCWQKGVHKFSFFEDPLWEQSLLQGFLFILDSYPWDINVRWWMRKIGVFIYHKVVWCKRKLDKYFIHDVQCIQKKSVMLGIFDFLCLAIFLRILFCNSLRMSHYVIEYSLPSRATLEFMSADHDPSSFGLIGNISNHNMLISPNF